MSQSATGAGHGRAATVPAVPAPSPPAANGTAGAPAPRAPKRMACPICATTFEPRASAGQCPVCGEQVVPAAAVTRQIAGVSPALRWLADGGWRLVLVLLLAVYQIALLIVVWILLAHKHLV